MTEAAAVAGADSGASLLSRIDTVAVPVPVSWRRYPDPGRLVASRLGSEPAASLLGRLGGNTGQLLINRVAGRIAVGASEVALIAGAEAMRTRLLARRQDVWLDWDSNGDGDVAEPEHIGDDRFGATDQELALGVTAPMIVFPLFETALRARVGRSVADHQGHIARLWEHFAAVAAANPHAWYRDGFTADEIRTPVPGNRTVVFPYTKRMMAFDRVDQGAALVLCSYESARAAGIAEDRMVFLHSGADGMDHFYVSERDSLSRSPALRAVANAALGSAGLDVDDVARFDLYSCFPSAVEVALDELGLAGPVGGDSRPLTVTGGLSFFGGPPNTYVLHAAASMVEACRADPDSTGLVTGLGWYLAKHSAAIYSTRPPERGFAQADDAAIRGVVAQVPRRTPVGTYTGRAIVEATAVVHDQGRPAHCLVSLSVPGGGRTFATSDAPDLGAAMTEDAWEGREVSVAAEGTGNIVAA